MKKFKDNPKVKTFIAGGLAVAMATTGAVAIKHHKDNSKEAPKEDPKHIEYTIESGDTLTGISNRFYGSEIYFDDIADYNGIENPDQIRAGDVIKLPKEIANNIVTEEKKDETKKYSVVAGDNLTNICGKFYGDKSYDTVLKVAKFNNIENPDDIKIGQTIELPPFEELNNVQAYPYSYELEETIKR